MPRQGPPPTPPPAAPGLPDWVLALGGALILGGIAQVIYSVDAGAGYAFATLVIVGYVASGGRLDAVMQVLRDNGFVKGG